MIRLPASAARSAPTAAERDPRVGLGQGRGVVDAVADHRDLAARAAPLLDPPRLLGRQQLRRDGVGVDLLRHRAGGRLAIAGQDRDLADLQVPQVVDDVVRLGADRVVDSDGARDGPVHRHEHRRLAPRIDLGQQLQDRGIGLDPVLGQEAPIADEHPMRLLTGPAANGQDARAGQDGRLGRRGHRQRSAAGLLDDRRGERVAAGRLGRGRQPQ